jgi:hypothetical protein
MKKLLLLSIILIMGLSMQAQNIMIKTKAYSVSFNNNQKWSDWSEWEDANLLIKIDLNDESITIDNQFEDKFYIRTITEEGTGKDKDGDTWTKFGFDCYDKDGTACNLYTKAWDDYNIVHLYVNYSNVQYVYTGKRLL